MGDSRADPKWPRGSTAKCKAIPFQVAEITIIKRHYLHRSCQITWAFGAYMGNRLKGVLTIGKPPSWSLQCGLVGASKQEFKNPECRAHDVYELNRLLMHNDMPKNSESRFVAWCLREVRKLRPRLVLVSYADTKKNHIGVTYQATNWIYTGTNTAFKDIHPEGYSDHRSVLIAFPECRALPSIDMSGSRIPETGLS